MGKTDGVPHPGTGSRRALGPGGDQTLDYLLTKTFDGPDPTKLVLYVCMTYEKSPRVTGSDFEGPVLHLCWHGR
jgi:hypothetical protein